jgi:purine-binding chemotaxis protein CheW
MGAASSAPLGARYVVFHLADCTYAIPVEFVQEIVPIAELAAVPGSPLFLSGFLDIGGNQIPVVSLRRLWQMPEGDRHLYTPLMVLTGLQQQIALEIDRVTQISEINAERLIQLEDGCSVNNCAASIARINGIPIVVLRPERILLEQEQERLAALTELAEQRIAQLEVVAP